MTSVAFSPFTLRGVTFRNRVWMPPMCQYSALGGDGLPTDWHLMHYGSIASGGAGAIIVEATGVVPEGRISPYCLGLWNSEQAAAFRRITEFVHREGARIGIQLAHSGRKGSIYPEWQVVPGIDEWAVAPGAGTLQAPGTAAAAVAAADFTTAAGVTVPAASGLSWPSGFGAEPQAERGSVPLEEGGWQTVAPSAIAFPGYEPPRELATEEIPGVIAAFAAAAERAVQAGFDFVELHAAHGYLLHQFLSPLSNQRTDAYGGDLDGRARLLLEVARAVRGVLPEWMPLLVRISATEWVEGGFGPDETVQVAKWLREEGVDLIDVSTAGNVPASIPVGPGYQVPFATRVREEAGVPVAAVGLLTDAHQVEHLLATGQADVALIGREVQRNPYFPVQAALALGAADVPFPRQAVRAFRALLPGSH